MVARSWTFTSAVMPEHSTGSSDSLADRALLQSATGRTGPSQKLCSSHLRGAATMPLANYGLPHHDPEGFGDPALNYAVGRRTPARGAVRDPVIRGARLQPAERWKLKIFNEMTLLFELVRLLLKLEAGGLAMRKSSRAALGFRGPRRLGWAGGPTGRQVRGNAALQLRRAASVRGPCPRARGRGNLQQHDLPGQRRRLGRTQGHKRERRDITLWNNILHSNLFRDIKLSGVTASSSNNLTSDTTGTSHSQAGG